MGLAILFPGQGSQYPAMADPWLEHEAGRSVLDVASEVLGRDIVDACRDEALLATTAFVQPALLACDVAAFRVLAAEGVEPAAAAGHSLGEFAALVAAGAMDLPEALEAVRVRGAAMQDASERFPGTMVALIGLTEEQADQVCRASRGDDVLAVANENAANQFVLSGSEPAVARAESEARRLGGRAIRLNVAGAFHSPLMEPALQAIRAVLERTTIRPPVFPVVANVTAGPEQDPNTIRELLGRHVIRPVRWHASMRTLAGMGVGALVEAGPGQVLSRLARRSFPGITVATVGSAAEAAAARGEAEPRS